MSQVPNPPANEQTRKLSLNMDRLIACSKFPVYHATSPDSNAEYAVKVFPHDKANKLAFARELEVLTTLSHPNIIRCISQRKMKIQGVLCNMLITEYAPHGDFFDLVMSKKLKSNQKLIESYFYQLIQGLDYLHSESGIAHGDLKLENILVAKDYSLKIIDFDQARPQYNSSCSDYSELYGTEGYRAPEVTNEECQDMFAMDIYAAGVLLYVFITGEMPFVECQEGTQRIIEGYDLFCNDNAAFWSRKTRRHQDTVLMNKDLQNLINGMLARDPKERLTITQVKESEWFKSRIIDVEIVKRHSKRLFEQDGN